MGSLRDVDMLFRELVNAENRDPLAPEVIGLVCDMGAKNDTML